MAEGDIGHKVSYTEQFSSLLSELTSDIICGFYLDNTLTAQNLYLKISPWQVGRLIYIVAQDENQRNFIRFIFNKLLIVYKCRALTY